MDNAAIPLEERVAMELAAFMHGGNNAGQSPVGQIMGVDLLKVAEMQGLAKAYNFGDGGGNYALQQPQVPYNG